MKKAILLLVIAITGFGLFGKSENEAGVSITENSYPMTLTDSKEREITIEKEPLRVISVAPNITEIIFALGESDRLIGRTDYCDYPSEAGDIESIGNLMEPNIEKIASLNPDIVLAGTHIPKNVVEKLSEIGIVTVMVQEEKSLEDVYTVIERIATILNVTEKGLDLTTEMRMVVESITSRIPEGSAPTAYYVVGFGEYGDFTAGGDTFVNDIIETAGGINIASDVSGWTYSLEKLIENNPDIVICSKYWGTEDGLKAANGYKDLPAITGGNLYAVDDNRINRPGPRVVEGIRELAEIFYPEVFNE